MKKGPMEAEEANYIVVLCPYCDGTHYPEECPRVAEIEYFNTYEHRIKRVVFVGSTDEGGVYCTCPVCGGSRLVG